MVALINISVRKLKARNVDFTAGVRKRRTSWSFKADGIDATYIDVAKQSIDELIELFKPYDQILFPSVLVEAQVTIKQS